MKIELGNFGYSRTEVVTPADKSQVSEALGSAGLRISAAERQAQENREAFQRAGAANSFAKYQLDLETVANGVEQDMATGAVPWDKANEEFVGRASKLPAPQDKLDNPIDRENQRAGISHATERTRQSLAPSIFQARQRTGASQFDSFLDTQAKRAIEPGANIDQINASADAFAVNARVYGLPENVLTAKVQAFKDSNWYNSALQRVVESDGNLPALKGILHELTNDKGAYAGKLDPQKRASLQAAVQNQIEHIELRAQASLDRRDARGERAVAQIERQISSGIPATAEMWAGWGDTIKGTSSEKDFNELVSSEQEIQGVLRKPVADQVRLVQEKEAALLQGGGTVAQGSNVARLKNAVDSNVKLLTQNPVVFGEERLGDKNQPLDFQALTSEQGQHETAAILQERAARVRALGKQFQAPVPMRPLLPQEAKQLGDALNSASPQQASVIFGALSDASGSPDVFRGMMQQVAPDSPVRALAGMLAAKQRDLVMTSHWYKPDDLVASRDVAATMLEGDRLLNRSSTAKAEDGKAQTKLVLPETKLLQDRFANEVGTAFAGRPQAAEVAFQAMQAYYAGRVAQTGKIASGTDDVDGDLVREAVRATLGNVVDFNGRGDVIAPWGMAEEDFNDRAVHAYEAERKRRGLPEATDADRSLLGLTNAGAEGIYGLTVGRRLLLDDAGRPVTLDLRPYDPRQSHGYIERNP
jgi:hypothetical protein